MTVQLPLLKNIVEAALLAAGRPLSIDELMALFSDAERPERTQVRKALDMLQTEFAEPGRYAQRSSQWFPYPGEAGTGKLDSAFVGGTSGALFARATGDAFADCLSSAHHPR